MRANTPPLALKDPPHLDPRPSAAQISRPATLGEICGLGQDEEPRVPRQVEETIPGAHASTLDWRTLLRRYMTDAASHDYSWSVPNRRFIDGGLYLPSIRSEGIETIAVIVDTSGSLPTATLAEFWAELREVAVEIGPETVIVLQVDAAVQDAAEYAADDLPEEIAVKGQDGTNFRPGFAWLDEQGIQPGVCLYFTDMECSDYPEAEPSFDVLWFNYASPPSHWNLCARHCRRDCRRDLAGAQRGTRAKLLAHDERSPGGQR